MGSNISNMLTSESRTLINENKDPNLKNKSELKILFSKFDELYIGFRPIGSNNLHILSNHILNFRKKLPKGIGAKKFVILLFL